MIWYANQLLQPAVKAVVLVTFAGLTAGCIMSASKLTQEFNFIDMMPDGSYAADFYYASQDYYFGNTAGSYIYFRNVDQSDPDIQDQMEAYLADMVTIDAVEDRPAFFWLTDFKLYAEANNNNDDFGRLSFEEQLALFLADPEAGKVYERDIVIDERTGEVTASRCGFEMPNIDVTIVKDQVDTMKEQRAVSARQPINNGDDDWAFFSFGAFYNIWEFYLVTIDELTFTTIMGVVAVTCIAIILIPHWTDGLFVCPLISLLYVNLLGFMQFAGLHINALTYVSLVMSIGLLVDFVVHVLLRFYESLKATREEKVKDTLRSMGSSIFIGGLSTFLGVIPLAFSSSAVFTSIFLAFMGLVAMGISHGLILLPVVLSIIGPENYGESPHNINGASSPIHEPQDGTNSVENKSKILEDEVDNLSEISA